MQPVRILISENCIEYASLLSQRLSMYPDFTIIGIASDGEKTLELLKLLQPDVLLLDIVMPRIDGLCVLRKIRDDRLKTAVYVMSALSSDNIVRNALSLGARHYFVKPFNTESMVTRIRELRMYH